MRGNVLAVRLFVLGSFLVGVAAFLFLSGEAAHAGLPNINVLQVRYVTTYKTPSGSVVTHVTPGLIETPTLIDATGQNGAPNIVATPLAFSLSHFQVTFDRLPTAMTANLPIAIDLIVNDPTNGASLPRQEIHGGYDATTTNAPDQFKIDITIGTAPNGDPHVQTATTVTPHDRNTPHPLTLMGGLFNGDPLNPQQPLGGRLTYNPMPWNSSFGMTIGHPIVLTAGTPIASVVDASVVLDDGTNVRRMTAHVDKLPHTLDLSVLAPTATLGGYVDLADSDPIGAVDATMSSVVPFFPNPTSSSAPGPTHVFAHLRGIPAAAHATIQAGGTPGFGFTIDHPIAIIDGLLTSQATPTASDMLPGTVDDPSPYPGVLLHASETVFAAQARLLGLKAVSYTPETRDSSTPPQPTGPTIVHAEALPQVLHIDAVTGMPGQTLTVGATVTQLPATLNLAILPPGTSTGGYVDLNNSDPVDAVDATVRSATPFFPNPTSPGAPAPANLFAHLRGIPAALHATVQSGNTPGFGFTIDHPIAIIDGLLTSQATPTASDMLPGTADDATPYPGLLFHAEQTVFAAQARVLGLKAVSYTPATFAFSVTTVNGHPVFGPLEPSTPTVVHAEAAPQVLHVDAITGTGDSAITLGATVNQLPATVDVSMLTPDTHGQGGYVHFNASDSIASVTVSLTTARELFSHPFATASTPEPGPRHLAAEIDGIPAELQVDIVDGSDGSGFSADHPIGAIGVLVSTDTTQALTPLGDLLRSDGTFNDGVYADIGQGVFTAEAHVEGLQKVQFAGAPLALHTVTSHAQPFVIDATVDRPDDLLAPGTIKGSITNLPTTVDLVSVPKGFQWDASDGIAEVALHGRLLPSVTGGFAGDGNVHAVDAVLDQAPAHFLIDLPTNGGPEGVEAVGTGAAFGHVFVQASDDPFLTTNIPPDANDAVKLDTLSHGGGQTFYARVNLLDLHSATYVAVGTLVMEVHAEFTSAPSAIALDVQTPGFSDVGTIAGSSTIPLPTAFDLQLGNTPNDVDLEYTAPNGGVIANLPLRLRIPGVLGSDLTVANVPPGVSLCLAIGTFGCNQVNPFPGFPPALTLGLVTKGNGTTPLTIEGGLCIKPSNADDTWEPVCQYDTTNDVFAPSTNTYNQVSFDHVSIRDARLEVYNGDSLATIPGQTVTYGSNPKLQIVVPKPVQPQTMTFFLDTADPNNPSDLTEIATEDSDVAHGIMWHHDNPCWAPEDRYLNNLDIGNAQTTLANGTTVPVTTADLTAYLAAHYPGCTPIDVLSGNADFHQSPLDTHPLYIESKGDSAHPSLTTNHMRYRQACGVIDYSGALPALSIYGYLDFGDRPTLHYLFNLLQLPFLATHTSGPDPGPTLNSCPPH